MPHKYVATSTECISVAVNTGLEHVNSMQNMAVLYNTRHLPADEILCAFGDTDNFRLEQLIEPEFSEEEINILKPSEYYSIETLPIQLKI